MVPYVGMANGDRQLELGGPIREVMHNRGSEHRDELLVSLSNARTKGHQLKLIGGRSERRRHVHMLFKGVLLETHGREIH